MINLSTEDPSLYTSSALLIRNTSADNSGSIRIGYTNSGAPGIQIGDYQNLELEDSSITMYNSNTDLTVSIINNGTITVSDKVNATNGFYETSDERLKDFSDDIKVNLDALVSIPTKYFTWKSDEDKKVNIGTSAQEIQKIYPELVSENDKGELSVDYAKLSVVCLAAIKELKKELDEIKSK